MVSGDNRAFAQKQKISTGNLLIPALGRSFLFRTHDSVDANGLHVIIGFVTATVRFLKYDGINLSSLLRVNAFRQ